MKYLYYKLFQQLKGRQSDEDTAIYPTFAISFFEGLNAMAVFSFANTFLKIQFYNADNVEFFGGGLTLFFFVINYFVLYKNFKNIKEKYADEKRAHSIVGNILLYSYMIISCLLVYFS